MQKPIPHTTDSFTLDLGEIDTRHRWQTRPPRVFPSAWACEWGFDEYGLWQCFQVKGIKHKMRYIPSGEFWMGSPADEPERSNDETLHHVTLTEGFWLGETAVTQALWQAVMSHNPSHFTAKHDELLPVEQVSWNDCQQFIHRLKAHDALFVFALPSEAQWEYACRAGMCSAFNVGETLAKGQANLNANETLDVHHFPANAWGLKQMHGNVWEWCADSPRKYKPQAEVDIFGATNSKSRALRGGSWVSDGRLCRSAYRSVRRCDHRSHLIGLRLSVN